MINIIFLRVYVPVIYETDKINGRFVYAVKSVGNDHLNKADAENEMWLLLKKYAEYPVPGYYHGIIEERYLF